jgi:hypothetical protein
MSTLFAFFASMMMRSAMVSSHGDLALGRMHRP